VPTTFNPSRNITDGDTIAAGNTTGSLHQVTGSLRITGSLFVNGVLLTGSGGGGGGGSPGAPNDSVQRNDGAGGFAGNSAFTIDVSTSPPALSASTIKMSGALDIPDALVIGPTFDFTPFGMGMVHAPGLISVPSSSHPLGMAGFMAWGPDGPGASQPVTSLSADGLSFQSSSTSWPVGGGFVDPPVGIYHKGILFSGTAGPGGSGPTLMTAPEGNGIMLAPTFPPNSIGGPGSPSFYAPGLITIASSSALCGLWIMADGPPVMQLTPGQLTFSGSNTTSSTDIHPLVSADMFQTSDGAIQIGQIGDPDGPGGLGNIYQSGTLMIRSGTHNKFVMQGSSGAPVVMIAPDGLMFSASAEGGALSIMNGPLKFSHPARASIDFSDTGEGAAALEMPDNMNEGFMFRVQGSPPGESNFLTFKTTTGTESVVSNKPLGIGLPEGGASPNITLDVHYTGSGNPLNLGHTQGGGEVVFFGTGSTSIGSLHYLKSDGNWAKTDASATGSGHNQLLGIALGASATGSGMLVKGYFNAIPSYSGSFTAGGPVYVGLDAGAMSGTAPASSNEFVRVVGYGTDKSNIIYFNPDSTYIEIA